jgi:hypothetical protein
MLQAPHDFLSAWEPLLTDGDPWVRALARLQLGKMRIMLGQAGPDADAELETALAEFRALGERWGISFALTELADRIAAACGYLDQAIAVVTEIGAIEDVARIRSRQAQLYWLLGDKQASAAAMGEAERAGQRVAWPYTLAAPALTKAELARWQGDTEEAGRELGVAATLLDPEQPIIRAAIQDLLGYLADGLDQAREHRAAALRAATEAGIAPVLAKVLVGIADLALRREQAARRCHGDAGVAEATREGTQGVQGTGTSWPELARATLAG